MKSSHFGIFALVSLSLLLTVPSAFADVVEDNPAIQNSASNSNAAFKLMNLITNGQNEAAILSTVIENNGLNQSLLDDFTDALNEAAALSAAGDLEGAQAALDEADALLDDVYDEIYDEVDSQQSARYDNFVDDAITSLTFLVENGATLGLTDVVIDELKNTLAILEGGDYDEIIAATSETSNTGLTLSMFPGLDNASPTAKANENAKGVGLVTDGSLPAAFKNLPDKIKDKFGFSTDSIGSQSSDGTGDNNGDSVFPGFGAALNNDGQGPSQTDGQGVGLAETPPGLFNIGWSPDDWYAGFAFDDFLLPFDEDFEPGAAGREKAAMKRAAGIAKGIAARDGNGPPEGTPGPPCSPPCVPPPPPGPPNPPGGPPNPPGGP